MRGVVRVARRGAGGIGDVIFSRATLLGALVVIGILLGAIIVLTIDAWPSAVKFGPGFVWSTAWDAVRQQFGALPAIFGTLVSSFLALLFAVPVSIGAAIFLSELAPRWLSTPASFLIELLAAIPSVIIGLLGVFVLVPVMRSVQGGLQQGLGFLPFFQGLKSGLGFLTAGVILAIMITPIITALSRDALKAVPVTQREGMLALGATRWETISRAVLAYSRSGLVGSVILALARAMGETMAVTMVIGNGYRLTASLFSPGATIASTIANQFSEATSELEIGALIELALILFAVTLVVNVVARVVVWRLTSVKAIRE